MEKKKIVCQNRYIHNAIKRSLVKQESYEIKKVQTKYSSVCGFIICTRRRLAHCLLNQKIKDYFHCLLLFLRITFNQFNHFMTHFDCNAYVYTLKHRTWFQNQKAYNLLAIQDTNRSTSCYWVMMKTKDRRIKNFKTFQFS